MTMQFIGITPEYMEGVSDVDVVLSNHQVVKPPAEEPVAPSYAELNRAEFNAIDNPRKVQELERRGFLTRSEEIERNMLIARAAAAEAILASYR